LLIRGDVFSWGPFVASVPVVLPYAFLKDYYLSSLVTGATKG